VKSLKRFDLNLNLKGCFEKGLKKEKKGKLTPLTFRPSGAVAHAAVSFFFFSFSRCRAGPTGQPLLFLLPSFPPPLLRLSWSAAAPAASDPLHPRPFHPLLARYVK
jgi:hypothetical protein